MEELIIYLLSINRNKDTILQFLNNFTSIDEIRILNNDIMVIPSSYSGNIEKMVDDDFIWINVATLDDIIEIGLSDLNNAFSCYFKVKHDRISNIILTFTVDGLLLLGLCLVDTDENFNYAKNILDDLKEKFNLISGAIFTEQIPALTRKMFEKNIKKSALYKI